MTFLAVLDPAWKSDQGGGGKGANNHYHLSSSRALAGAVRNSGAWPMDADGIAWVWATTLSVIDGSFHDFVGRLAVRPCASFVWSKTDDVVVVDEIGVPHTFKVPRRSPGIGRYQRCDHEFLILCRRGDDLEMPEGEGSQHRSVISASVAAHSAKPQEAWALIESASRSILRGHDDVVATEFFCREQRPGWGAWGTLDGPEAPVVYRPATERWSR